MLKFAALIINRGVAFSQIGMVFISIIPTFLEVAIPLATLLGVMLAFGRLSGDSEVIVMRSSGISIFSLLKPVIAFGAFCGLLTLFISLYISPWGFRNLDQTLFEIARTESLAGLEQGIFNKLGRLTLYAEEINYSSGALKNVLIDDKRDSDNRQIITSLSGSIESDEASRTITLHLKNGYVHQLVQGKYVLTRYDTNSLVMDSNQMYDPDSDKQGPSLRELSLSELSQTREELKQALPNAPEKIELDQLAEAIKTNIPQVAGAPPAMTRAEIQKKIYRIETERNRRFSMPYAAFILALLGLPLGIQVPRTQRTWGAGLSAVLGMAAFVVYYALLSVGVAFAENGKISSMLALWLPNVITTAFTLYASYQIGFERWHSISHAIELLANRIYGKFSARLAQT